MKNELKTRTGGQLLVDALKVHGVDTAFCVPGESYLAVLDALYDAREAIKLFVCRQEGGAANMAEAYGKLTGKPGICMVTRGPGATNAAIGVHTAFQDSTPMILLIGQVGTDLVEREAFQEVDFRRMYGQMAKWVASIDRVERVPEYMSHAFHCAMSGRKGPVVLALPEDMLTQTAIAADTDPYREVVAHPGADDVAKLRAMLAAATRPLVIVGGSGWNAKACADLRSFVEANGPPAGCAFRFQDLFDNTHANYAGDIGIGINPKLAQRVKDADLLLVIGARLGEMTTSAYTLLSVPRPAQQLIHVHAGAEELGRVYQGDLLINSGMPQIAAALAAMQPVDAKAWSAWTQSAHADYLEWTKPRTMPGKLQLWDVVDFLRQRLPADAILTNGAGNYSSWLHRFYPHRRFRTQLAPTSGAMGYGVPSAIAAKIVHPERTVISWNGDGCFLMCGQELATAAQYGVKVIFIVVNNGMYGTIRMHQEREYPARVHGTALANPDFVMLARAYGAHGELVEETAQFAAAFERAVNAMESSGKPALIELRIDPQAITPNTTLDALREQAQKRTG
ncbi:MAG: thiamine pyrophosphate-binding protein [Burkholderiales bacterium]|nr:thiamine pyrophosphate-binding protein [Burkholderiales bacterium]